MCIRDRYRAVCKRGGAQNVSDNKLWKEIVNEFGLPPSCTSASFTLRNHYNKYLLAYEQKFFFGRDDNSALQEVKGSRPRIKPKLDDAQPHITKEIHHQPPPVDPSKQTSLKQNLNNIYGRREKTEEILFTKKHKLSPIVSEIRRILLAFESHIKDEVTFALNSLLMYSCNTGQSFILEQHLSLLDNMVCYMEEIIKNIPSLRKIHHSLYVDKNYNYEIADIVTQRKDPSLPLEAEVTTDPLTGEKPSFYVRTKYELVSEIFLIEQLRVMFLIFRNLSYIKANEAFMFKHERFVSIVLEFFTDSNDNEIARNCLDILNNLSRNIIMKNLNVDVSKFCKRVFDYLTSESHEEVESAVDILRHLLCSQENEAVLESMLALYIETLTRLLINPSPDIREGVLEVLCFVSDLKMSTRVTLAKEAKLLSRLVANLHSSAIKGHERITKLSALILSNISLAPAAKSFFLPFERDIFVVAATDETISSILCNILSDLDTIGGTDTLQY
eukprot:TRINITY_DN12677_c0_g1_i1.p1 TRINITY_DN12677_c0_g1~~TRINITY_DN12677_c0_g1_i1.p1  ORF type:complete len:520 (-),score=157.82 TRINITY_DN12677_c0_g1_i1:133-1635(-)